MPKSKQRKGHKEKVASYKKKTLDAKRSFDKKMRDFYMEQQQMMLQKQIQEQQAAEGQELEGLNIEDFELDTDIEPVFEEVIPTIVEGVTSPEELK